MSSLSRKKTYHQGIWAERRAIWLLRLKGYRILQHRFRTPMGEIDIIAQHKNTLVMVEVKARSTLSEGLFAITPRQQERCLGATRFFLARFQRYQGADIRFDVVVQRPWRFPVHLRNVVFSK